MVADAAALRGRLVIDMGEGHGPELARLEVGFRGAQQQEVLLTALQAGRVLDPLDGELVIEVVTVGAELGAGGPLLDGDLRRRLSMTADARLVRDHLVGLPVLLGLLAMAVAARALLALGVDELVGLRFVDVVAGFAPLLGRFDMAVVQGLVHPERLSRRRVQGLALVTVAAGDRARQLACIGGLLVTADALVVVEVDEIVLGDLLQSLEARGGLAVGIGGMAERAVLFALRHDLGVQVVRKQHGGPLQLFQRESLADRDQIRPGRGLVGGGLLRAAARGETTQEERAEQSGRNPLAGLHRVPLFSRLHFSEDPVGAPGFSIVSIRMSLMNLVCMPRS